MCINVSRRAVRVTSTFHPLLTSFGCGNGKPASRCGSSPVAMTTAQTRPRLVLGLLPNLLRYSTSCFTPPTRSRGGSRGEEVRTPRSEGGGREVRAARGSRSFLTLLWVKLHQGFLRSPPTSSPAVIYLQYLIRYAGS